MVLPVNAGGIAWYRAQDYTRPMAMFTDGGHLPDTFESWSKSAQLYETLTAQRHVAVKAYIGSLHGAVPMG